MSDLKKPGDEPLFREATIQDQLRTLLSSVSDDPAKVAELSDRQVSSEAFRLAEKLDDLAFDRARVERHVAAGKLTRAQADAMTPEEIHDYSFASGALAILRKRLDKPAVVRAEEPDPAARGSAAAAPPITAEQLIAIFGGLVAQLAKQQAQINELIDERDAFLAHFADRVLDRVESFAKGGRDYAGFEVSLDLENESAIRRDTSSESKTDTSSSTASARDTHGELRMLASHVAALGAGRKVNFDEMNRTVATVKAAGRSEVRERHKGSVTVKVGKISGKSPKDE